MLNACAYGAFASYILSMHKLAHYNIEEVVILQVNIRLLLLAMHERSSGSVCGLYILPLNSLQLILTHLTDSSITFVSQSLLSSLLRFCYCQHVLMLATDAVLSDQSKGSEPEWSNQQTY